ncbi:MAG: hypothetical protein WBX25_18390 [Rhodomicrobium sp.]
MPEPRTHVLFAAAAAAMLSANAALADIKSDDRSYLPPPELQVQGKALAEPETLPAKRRLRSALYKRAPGQTRRPLVHWRRRRYHAYWHARRDFAQRHSGRFYAHHHGRRFYAHYHARRSYASRGFLPGFFFGLFP